MHSNNAKCALRFYELSRNNNFSSFFFLTKTTTSSLSNSNQNKIIYIGDHYIVGFFFTRIAKCKIERKNKKKISLRSIVNCFIVLLRLCVLQPTREKKSSESLNKNI